MSAAALYSRGLVSIYPLVGVKLFNEGDKPLLRSSTISMVLGFAAISSSTSFNSSQHELTTDINAKTHESLQPSNSDPCKSVVETS